MFNGPTERIAVKVVKMKGENAKMHQQQNFKFVRVVSKEVCKLWSRFFWVMCSAFWPLWNTLGCFTTKRGYGTIDGQTE